MQTNGDYWFPAKRYGWGWSLPIAWQGWLVFLAFFALLFIGIYLFPPRQSLAAFLLYVIALSLVLIVICWLKGEPPRWRWGND
jgi:peptidoglycan/LPS O-acetylase OafA/YrhL